MRDETISSDEEEIRNYLEPYPQPIWKSTIKEKYSFSNFGIDSPLFDGKSVNVVELSFKRNIFHQNTLELKDSETNKLVYVVTWTTTGPVKNALTLTPTFLDPAWEGTIPTTLDDLQKASKHIYQSKEGYTAYETYQIYPSGEIYGVSFTFFKKYSPSGSLFAQISTRVDGTPSKNTETSNVVAARSILKRIIDKISIK